MKCVYFYFFKTSVFYVILNKSKSSYLENIVNLVHFHEYLRQYNYIKLYNLIFYSKHKNYIQFSK
jgi:hypothetical protein